MNPSPGAIAVDATHAYFTDYGQEGAIRRVPRGGGTVEHVLLCGAGCFPQAVRVDSKSVYFRLAWSGCPAQSGMVQAMSKADWKVAELSGGNGDGGYMYGREVEVNDSVAYWNRNGGHAPSGIFRADADGTGFKPIVTSNDTSWLGLRVDDVAVYYWRLGALVRVLK